MNLYMTFARKERLVKVRVPHQRVKYLQSSYRQDRLHLLSGTKCQNSEAGNLRPEFIVDRSVCLFPICRQLDPPKFRPPNYTTSQTGR